MQTAPERLSKRHQVATLSGKSDCRRYLQNFLSSFPGLVNFPLSHLPLSQESEQRLRVRLIPISGNTQRSSVRCQNFSHQFFQFRGQPLSLLLKMIIHILHPPQHIDAFHGVHNHTLGGKSR